MKWRFITSLLVNKRHVIKLYLPWIPFCLGPRRPLMMNSKGASGQCKLYDNINKIAINTGSLRELHQKIRVINFRVIIDNAPTQIDESSSTVLKYKTPNFRACATVEMAPTADKVKWKVGWIQACTDMMFRNTYGAEGFTSWEFPELVSGAQVMISDCDGHHYPWYGSHNETVTFEGPAKMYQNAELSMNDNFHPHVTWRNPANNRQGAPNLTHITRDQSFYVWLVAWNKTAGKAYILQTARWNMKLDIDVDPTKPLGQRARLVSNPVPRQPQVLEENIPIPKCAILPPNANSAQMLVWRPKVGKNLCIIKPVWNKDVPLEQQVTRFDSKLCKL